MENSPQIGKRQFGQKEKKDIILLKHIHGEEASIRRAEEEEEKGEGKSCRTNESGVERLKLGPTKLWTGLVLHHKDVFVSHVISKLNGTDRWFFSKVNRESRDVLKYAGVNVSKLRWAVYECSSISTLEWCGITRIGERKIKWKSDRSSLVLRKLLNEQTRVSQVGERSETVRVG